MVAARGRERIAWVSGLGVVGGALLAWSGEPWSQSWAGFLSVAVLAEAIARTEQSRRPVLEAILAGLLFGGTVNAFALFSLVELLESFGSFPAIAAWATAALAWIAQGAPYIVAAGLCAWCRGRGLSVWLCLPPLLVASLAWFPQLFPWHLASPQVNFLPFAQMADLGGEPLLDLCLAFMGTGIYRAIRAQGRGRWYAVGVAAAALLLPCAYGYWRIDAIRDLRERAPSLRVGVVQSNVGIQLKGFMERAPQILTDLREMTQTLERRGVDVTLWAETSYPYPLPRTLRMQLGERYLIVDERQGHTARAAVDGPVLFGTLTYATDGSSDSFFNSAWLVNKDGSLGDRVDKSRLLAFGEYVPFWHELPILQTYFPSPGLEPGENDVIRVPLGPGRQTRFGVLICYEDLFFSLAKQVVDLRAQLLVNMTNDAWFGRSNEPILHDMVARLRAIETRRDFVRAVNTGVSSFTRATGELVTRTGTFEKVSFVADAKLLDVRSPYVQLGDWVSPLCALALGISLVLRGFGPRIRRALQR